MEPYNVTAAYEIYGNITVVDVVENTQTTVVLSTLTLLMLCFAGVKSLAKDVKCVKCSLLPLFLFFY
jgi:hypothetical protein